MQETQHITHADDEIDLRELFRAIWAGKWLILVVTSIFTAASIYYALKLPDIYKSEVTLAPVAEDSALKNPGQLGGLAAMAGVNLGGLGGGDKTGLALEILKSRDFIGRFIEQNDLYVPIMAAVGWNRGEDRLLLDPKIYDEHTKQWVREIKPPYKPKPSKLETYEEFEKLLMVEEDKATNMITLSIKHYSPFLAKKWADKIVNAINEEMRVRELTEAEKSIAYLNNQINQTNLADIRTMLFSLIEEQNKTLMLANVRDEYVFKTVDPAVVAEKKHEPRRLIIVLIVGFISMFISIFFVLVRYFNSKD